MLYVKAAVELFVGALPAVVTPQICFGVLAYGTLKAGEEHTCKLILRQFGGGVT